MLIVPIKVCGEDKIVNYVYRRECGNLFWNRNAGWSFDERISSFFLDSHIPWISEPERLYKEEHFSTAHVEIYSKSVNI